ncbi:MAG: hypothetical protein V7605_885 [Acidimicrobiaceae bacterium]|jgi:predicted PurR-regulated permease PerM
MGPPIMGFAAGGWWVGFAVASTLIAVLAALVLSVVAVTNRLERQAGSIIDHLTATADGTRPLLDLVETNLHLAAGARALSGADN